MTLDIQGVAMALQPFPAGFGRQGCHGHVDASIVIGCAAGEVDLDRLDDLTSAERRSGSTTAKQDLVDIVMQDQAKTLEIVAAETKADRPRQAHRRWYRDDPVPCARPPRKQHREPKALVVDQFHQNHITVQLGLRLLEDLRHDRLAAGLRHHARTARQAAWRRS